MLSVLGVGHAYPRHVITNQLLGSLSGESAARQPLDQNGILQRSTGLPEAYLVSSKNSNPEEGLRQCESSPTDLALSAAEMALTRAGITKDQVGLILGDTSTPYQTTPGESQRLGERLGIKIDAYDLIGGTAALPLHFDSLFGWRAERTPEYVLSVSTNTATQRVRYDAGIEQTIFGDGAAAAVLSRRHEGKLRVVDTFFETRAKHAHAMSLSLHGHIGLSPGAESIVDEALTQMFDRALLKNKVAFSSLRVIVSALTVSSEKAFAARYGLEMCVVPEDRVRRASSACLLTNLAHHGHSIGSHVGGVIGMDWDRMERGAHYLLVTAGFGFSAGYVLLEVG